MFSGDDHRHMAHALRLAERGLFTTDPNPRVGCVLVRDGEVVGEGWHERTGEPHAEINALHAAGDQAANATAYVTLEPCCHQGRTPPCTDSLIKAGVSRVIVAMQDPNPQVAGKGLQILQQAGIETSAGLMALDAEKLNPGFMKRMKQGRPWIRCKLAMSLDGRTAMADGESNWISSEQARLDVHKLRARCSAIMTGINTVLSDDPSLTVRLGETGSDYKTPLRVVLDSGLRMPAAAKLLGLPGETLIVTGVSDPSRLARMQRLAGVSIKTLPLAQGRLDLAAVLQYLGEMEINEVHLEAGATLCGALLEAGLVDELVIYMAPHLMGDAARGLFVLPGLEHMQDRINLTITDIRAIGDDWRITAMPATK